MLAFEATNDDTRRMWLFYAVRAEKDAVYDETIRQRAAFADSRIEYVKWIAAEQGAITAKAILAQIGALDDYAVLLCGPPPMMRALQKQFLALGLPRHRIIFEDFAFRQPQTRPAARIAPDGCRAPRRSLCSRAFALLSMPPDLQSLRREIDAIDDAIHDLLMQRARVVGGVLAAKGKGGPVFQPGREADILRRLAARHGGALPFAAIAAVWRRIINAHTALQRPITVTVAARPPALAALAWQHFGGIGAIVTAASADTALTRARRGAGATLAVLPLPSARDDWWRALGRDGIFILAALPALGRPEALVVGRQPFLPGACDRGYVLAPAGAALLRQARAAGLAPRGRVAAARGLALIETAASVPSNDARLATLAVALGAKPGAVRSAGSIAAPIEQT
jgi:chorismate mutase